MKLLADEEEKIMIVKEYNVLGTTIQLSVYDSDDETAINEALERLSQIDDRMSAFKNTSFISKINNNAGGLMQEVSEDVYYVIDKAVHYAKLSEGAFDPTIRPLVNLWGVFTNHAWVPEKYEIEEKLRLVNYKDIVLDKSNYAVKLKHRNQCIDLGAIAKGYAADEVKRIFLNHNIKSAIIDLGGNIYALGNKLDGSSFNIGIQDPMGFEGESIGIVSVRDKSIVTSGNYERYFEKDGKRYHHIINPRTGYPDENGIISVTVISNLSIDGDGLTTCGYIMGLKQGFKLIEDLEGVEAIFITKDKKIYITSNLMNNFQLINSEYTLVL